MLGGRGGRERKKKRKGGTEMGHEGKKGEVMLFASGKFCVLEILESKRIPGRARQDEDENGKQREGKRGDEDGKRTLRARRDATH